MKAVDLHGNDAAGLRNISVLLVEDSRVLAERLRESLLDVPKARLVGRADNEMDAVAILRRSSVDVLLLDINLSQGSAFGVLRAIPTGQNKKALAIILTNHDLAEYRRAAAALGAREDIKAIVIDGRNLANFAALLNGKEFQGTIVG